MTRILRSLFVCILAFSASAQYTVTRFAGGESGRGYTDGATASSARFDDVTALAVAADGTLYVADRQGTIRVMRNGVVATVAGLAGVTGNTDGPGIHARFNDPVAIALGPTGDLYIAEYTNSSVRRMTPDGQVSTVARNLPGARAILVRKDGTILVGCADRNVRLIANGTVRIAIAGVNAIRMIEEENGDLLVLDFGLLRRVTRNGEITDVPGIPTYAGDVARDANGNLWLTTDSRIFRVSATAAKVDIFGDAVHEIVDGPLETTRFARADPIAIGNKGEVYIGDGATIRRIDSELVTTIAGKDVYNRASYEPFEDRLGPISTITRGNDGTIYVATIHGIRRILPSGLVSDLVPESYSPFWQIGGIAIDRHGNVYATDLALSVIQKVTPEGKVSLFEGRPFVCSAAYGPGGGLCSPHGIAFDAADNMYVADTGGNRIQKITAGGAVSTYAGGALDNNSDPNGVGTAARFVTPTDVAIDAGGNVYVAEWGARRIRKITPDRVVTTLTGTGNAGTQDGGPDVASFDEVSEIEAGATGLFVLDRNRLRHVTYDGYVTTIAGIAGEAAAPSEGTGEIARFKYARGLASDGHDGVYVADEQEFAIWYARPPRLDERASILTPRNVVNVPLQLATEGSDATTWNWSILRRPAGSFASFVATSTRTPLFTPDATGRYTFLLRAENANGGLRFSTVDVDVRSSDPGKRRSVR